MSVPPQPSARHLPRRALARGGLLLAAVCACADPGEKGGGTEAGPGGSAASAAEATSVAGTGSAANTSATASASDGGTTGAGPAAPRRWPAFRGGPRNDGRQDGAGALSGATPVWATAVGLGESSPTVGECDGDDGLEIVTFTYSGRLVGLDGDGSERFSVPLSGGGIEIASPTLADLDGDGFDEAIVGSNADAEEGGGKIHAVHCADGSPLWTFDAGLRVMASAVVADLPTGRAVVVRPEGGALTALDGATGALLWSVPEASGSHGSAAAADLDGDGFDEIVVGGYFEGYTVDEDGATRCTIPTGFTSTPAVADVDADGGLEIVVSIPGDGVFSFDGATCAAEIALDWPEGPLGWASSPAIVQLDGDAPLEIVATNGRGDDAAYAIDGASGTIQWRFAVDPPAGAGIADLESSPVAADLDGDGDAEVVVRSYNGRMYVLEADGAASWSHDFSGDGKSGNVASTPAVADVDADGALELVVQEATGKVYLFD